METSDCDGGLDRRVMNNVRFNARRLAYRKAVPGMAAEDYEQDLVLDLLRRSKAFDPKRSGFATFADRIVQHRSSALYARTTAREIERKTVSLEAPAGEDDS